MRIFLAGTGCIKETSKLEDVDYVLESFYSIRPQQIPLIKKHKMFLLDSGAFTFMNSSKGEVDFEKYLDRYIKFINENNIQYFFELDVDSIVGYDKVKQMRKRLEHETGKQCIPVWHKSRGLDEFIRLCKSYNYISIGGIVTKEIKPSEYKFFPKLISIAHANNCRIHGLGFTRTKELHKYHFDSVDSTSWLSGERFGQMHIFKDGVIETYRNKNKRVKKDAQANLHNLKEWIKFQKYANRNL